MSRKKVSQSKTTEHTVEKTALILVGFIVFVLAFVSLGKEISFRGEYRVGQSANVSQYEQPTNKIEEHNQAFLQEYMPAFEKFVQ